MKIPGLQLLGAMLVLLPLPAIAQTTSQPRSIAVTGQAEIRVVPDEVVFKVKVENVNLDLNAARAATDADVKKVFALARTYQIPPQNMQTYYINVDKTYEKVENKPSVFRGYEVSQTIVLLLPDIARFEKIFSDLLTMEVADVSDVDFRVSQMRKYMDQARSMALKAAREKAEAMASDLGQKVGRPYSITEVGMDVSSAYESGSSQSVRNNYSSDIGNVADNKGSIAPGMMSLTASVKVIFELN